MNLNKLAKEITLKEGLKESVSIAQVKEVMKLTLESLAEYEDEEILKTVKRYQKKYVRSSTCGRCF